MPDYDAIVSPDSLGTISINKDWRMVLTPAILAYFDADNSEISLDNHDLLMALLEELYA